MKQGRALQSALVVVVVGHCLMACASPTTKQVPPLPSDLGLMGGMIRQDCILSAPEKCFNAQDDNCNGLIDEGCGVRGGLIQFMIAWNLPKADVDLRVFDPNGELVEVGRKSRSGLVKEQDCPGRNDECRAKNFENVYLEGGDPMRGEYLVRVRLEALLGDTPPVEVTLGVRLAHASVYHTYFQLEAQEEERQFRFRPH